MAINPDTRQARTDDIDSPVQALAIVSEALNETIRDAQVALEDCVDGRGGSAALERAGELLHQARSALQMTQCYGAALLTEEMELCCGYLTSLQPGKGREDGFDALTRAMVQLPVYIERLLGGGRDIALVLLPMLNDLRAARGEPLLSEGTLLLLNLSPQKGAEAASHRGGNGEEPVRVATRLRPRFQLALLGWIKGGDSARHIRTLAEVTAALENASRRDDMYQLWWVVGGVLESLLDGGLETSVALKRLLGQTDRQIKHLIDEGEEAFDNHPVDDLLNNLLYYVARSSTARERVSAIRAAFNLAELLPGDEQVEHAREALSAPSVRLMNTVAAAIKEDLSRVKDVLDIFVRTGMHDSSELVGQLELLKKISDTLGVLGLGELRSDIDAEIDRLKSVVERGGRASEKVVLDIAATLLRVEDRLDRQLVRLTTPQPEPVERKEADVPAVQAADFQQVAESVMRECIINLARIKETISQSFGSDASAQGLDSIPTLIRGIKAGLMMLGKTRAMQVVERIGDLITLILKSGGASQLTQRDTDRLADAIVSIEYYMETVKAGRNEPWYMLDNAEACLSVLRDVQQRFEQLQGAKPEGATVEVLPTPYEAAAEAHSMETGATETGAFQATEVIPLPVVANDAEHLDPELLELFIEEAKEEIASVRRRLPEWSETPDDLETLILVRRSFHTLKGSGRMVGAERIGEYCWTIENLLNRLINQTLTRTPPMVDFILEAARAVPELVEQLEVGTEPDADINLLMARAHAFADGNPDAAVLVFEKPSEAGRPQAPALEMDPVLLDIFSKETSGHLAVINAYLAACDGCSPPFEVTDKLYRACHTLHGSANMANIERGVAVAGALNRYVRRVYDFKLGFEQAGLDGLREAATAIATIVEDINRPERQRADYRRLIEKLTALADAIEPSDTFAGARERPAAAVEPVSEDGGDDSDYGFDDVHDIAADADFDPDYDAEIAAIFTEESAELLEGADKALDAWTRDQRSRASLAELKRYLHTLKGGARMAGIAAMGDLSHEIEALLGAIDDGRVDATADLASLLQRSLDELHRMRDTVISGKPVGVARALERRINDASRGAGEAAGHDGAPQARRYAEELQDELQDELQRESHDESHDAMHDELHDELHGELHEEPHEESPVQSLEEAFADATPQPFSAEPAEPVSMVIVDPQDADAKIHTEADERAFEQAFDQPYEPADDSVGEHAEPVEAAAALAAAELSAEHWFAAVHEPADDAAATAAEFLPEHWFAAAHELADSTLEPADAAATAAEFLPEHWFAAAHELADSTVEPVEAPAAAPTAAEFLPEHWFTVAHELADSTFEPVEALAAAALSAEHWFAAAREALEADIQATVQPGSAAPAAFELPPEHWYGDALARGESVVPFAAIEPVELIAAGADAAAEARDFEADVAARAEPATAAGIEPEIEPEIDSETDSEADSEIEPGAEPEAGDAAERRAPRSPAERRSTARVDADLLEDLLNAAGEISIYHSRLSQQVNSFEFHVDELEQTITRLREQLRKLEIETEAQIMHGHQDTLSSRDFDPLELDRYSNIQQLSRALAESGNDLESLKDLLDNVTTEAESLLTQQSRVTAELQDGLMRTRMVPFERHAGRLMRLVRQVADEAGKRAELAVEGAAGELDRQVLEKMLPPFEHMLRNAVVHGLETPEERQARGKSPTGRITIRLHRQGTEMVIDIADDGRGLDVDAIRSKAYELDLLQPDSTVTDAEIMELILKPGFSTASAVTQTAGRGVGMDVVATEVKKLGGSLRISSVTGQGSNFTIRLPFTLAITQALIVRTGEEVYALPLPSVEGVARIPRGELEELMSQSEPSYQYGEQTYKFRHLGMYLGSQAAELPDDEAYVPVILVRAGEYSAALLTDEMLASREIVVKSVGPQLAGIRGISGATILGDGSIVLILDINALVRTGAPVVELKKAAPKPADDQPLALVVDDSITVRRVTERFLQRHGMRVLTAKDGLDAISVIQDNKPDIILLDIEMPRMDGYEFASHVRNTEEFADVPIVMITSRVGDKHRARAIELGVNDYLGKPYQDTQLLDAIRRQLEDRGIELT